MQTLEQKRSGSSRQNPSAMQITAEENSQLGYFLQYLSLAPVLAVVTVSVAFSTWAVINYFFPDLLFFPLH